MYQSALSASITDRNASRHRQKASRRIFFGNVIETGNFAGPEWSHTAMISMS
jgi:hypothetical protein